MKSTEFITEDKVKAYTAEKLQIDRAVKLLNLHCKESLATIKSPLWRGMRNHSDAIVMIDPSTGERKSANTSNYYTQIMSNSPYMEGWPKRNRSLICSSSINGAGGYGNLYALFPFDGAKIAVCPSWDLWETRIKVPGTRISQITEINHFMQTLGFPTSWESMVKYSTTETLQRRMQWQNRSVTGEELLQQICKALSPAKARFKLITIAEFAAKPPRDKECWTDSPVIAIRQTLYQKFLDAVNKGKQ